MTDRVPQDYLQSARRRLDNAADVYRPASVQQYDRAFLELSDVGMLVWSAGIDVVSALMRLDGYTDLGASSNRHRYLRHRLHNRYPQRDLRFGWSYLAQLHSFQHNLNLPETNFIDACQNSGRLFGELNDLLPPALRLPESAYAWLYQVS